MDLFDHNRKELLSSHAPLAARMRPVSLEDFVGQQHILGVGKPLRISLESSYLPSMILWGPPGTGKTTLANLIAMKTGIHFESVSAVGAGVADLRKIIDEAKNLQGMYSKPTLLFIDEIHRFNKAQQDVILPHVEDGTIILIGATTENPSFEVIAPLLSRCRVFSLKSLSSEEIRSVLKRSLSDKEKGLGGSNILMDEDAISYLVGIGNGDARNVLNNLEFSFFSVLPDSSGVRYISLKVATEASQQRSIKYDKSGDDHYDTISAFIKSIRASDPDASIYWLARMVEAGEDPMFIARRLVISASEDVGMADPQGLSVAVSAQQAVHLIGMPEGAIPLAEATVYLATAPKSNASYMALEKALKLVRSSNHGPVPMHLRNPVNEFMKNEGYGEGYKYPHNYQGGFVATENMPISLRNERIYVPSDHGYEKTISKRIQDWWGNYKK